MGLSPNAESIKHSWVTTALVLANVYLFYFKDTITYSFTFAQLFTHPLSAFTYMFAHGSTAHLMGNMMFLVFCGPRVEKYLGSRNFLATYLVCGVASGLGFGLFNPNDPLVGASGAICGILALLPLTSTFFLGSLVEACVVLYYFSCQTSYLLTTNGSNVAFLGHIAGATMGLICGVLAHRKWR